MKIVLLLHLPRDLPPRGHRQECWRFFQDAAPYLPVCISPMVQPGRQIVSVAFKVNPLYAPTRLSRQYKKLVWIKPGPWNAFGPSI